MDCSETSWGVSPSAFGSVVGFSTMGFGMKLRTSMTIIPGNLGMVSGGPMVQEYDSVAVPLFAFHVFSWWVSWLGVQVLEQMVQ
jgi:hypothetical protein